MRTICPSPGRRPTVFVMSLFGVGACAALGMLIGVSPFDSSSAAEPTEIAEAEGVRLEEKDLAIKDLLGADEVFLTNVIMMALPVVAVEAHTVGDGKVGAVTKKLIECFKKKVSTS